VGLPGNERKSAGDPRQIFCSTNQVDILGKVNTGKNLRAAAGAGNRRPRVIREKLGAGCIKKARPRRTGLIAAPRTLRMERAPKDRHMHRTTIIAQMFEFVKPSR
jgi:hypothetical protein